MTTLQAIILGIIQGITEFLPISSSAHLVIIPHLLGWDLPQEETFLFDVLVQTASLLAVVTFFWKELRQMVIAFLRGLFRGKLFEEQPARTAWLLILATLPAGLIGLAIKDLVEAAFSNPMIAAFFLLATAGLLITAEKLGSRTNKIETLSWKDALWIGLAQAAAIFPGVSRSGATITGAMIRGFERPSAGRFSFLMAIPIMLAAGLLAASDLFQSQNWENLLSVFIPGMLTSAVVSYISIRWLLRYLVHNSLYPFAIYCGLFSLITLLTTILR